MTERSADFQNVLFLFRVVAEPYFTTELASSPAFYSFVIISYILLSKLLF